MEIELYSKLQNPIEAIDRIGEIFSKSGMFNCQKVEQGKVLAMICMVERKSPVQVLKTYHIVDGNLSKKALAALAEFRASGGKHQWLKSGDETFAKEDERYAEIKLTDKENNEVKYRYSMADAKAEGLVKPGSRWTKRPGNMLRARCISNGLGMLCPEIFAGEDEPEEVSDRTEKHLLTKEPAATPKPEEKPAKVVEANVVVLPPESTQQPAEPKPEPDKPLVTTKPFEISDARIDATTGRLTVDTMAALEAVIGEPNMPAALTWLKGRKWIENSLSELNLERTKNILARPQAFLGHITKGGK